MKPVEKAKAEKTVARIESGQFDETDVESLLIRLRAYCGNKYIFREAADFVAHNDVRNKGVISAHLDAFYLQLKFFGEFSYQQKPVDLYGDMPKYLIRLLKYQVGLLSDEEVKGRNTTRERMNSQIDNSLVSAVDACRLRGGKIKKNRIELLSYLLGAIRVKPAFSPEQLLGDLVAVLKQNKIAFSESHFMSRGEMIVLCFMLLVHKTEFEVSDKRVVYCTLGIGDGKDNGKEGELLVLGVVRVAIKDREVNTVFCVFRSGLLAVDYCHPEVVAGSAGVIEEHLTINDGQLCLIKV
ncbi:hypothetical protein ACM7V1_21365 [Pseudomonas aeruginosa]|uniref:hypothetical protein n=1 Tax=Pseudomonas aeruginosa TaxID=287 RepID=UPI000F53C0A4|nr:hypothetical protein [Pseudomonas aeruginosa]MDP5547213.1 hypothetical protein [Pseudomonas aeruginosa]MDP6009740.1 hypothetical protein [Pseudomonas aeruginosa]MDY1360600.1 hypothetical protein [Pseudomonas aeruginosa]RQF81462.1 hypothetical protein IPC258_02055 [Pseudomonas aeruginosa]HBN7721553.1 hypothetical protein [Pseudomonas aeruginosa]